VVAQLAQLPQVTLMHHPEVADLWKKSTKQIMLHELVARQSTAFFIYVLYDVLFESCAFCYS